MSFLDMFRGRGWRRHKKRKKLGWLLVIVIPLVVLLAILVSFFVFDSFTYYYGLLLFNKQFDETLAARNESNYSDYSSWTTWGGSSESGMDNDKILAGESGLYALYVNSMSSGYYRETLELVRDHSNWKYMSDSVKPVETENGTIYPSMSLLLGLQLYEGGAENESDGVRISPVTALSRLSYDATDGKHTLSTYNSAVCAADGGSTLSSGYDGLDLTYHGSSYRTHMQFSASMAAIYPSGRYTDTASKYPSKLNGYGIPEGTVRTLADTDAAYYPDILSIALQRAWCAVSQTSMFDADVMDAASIEVAAYPIYNMGEGSVAYSWGLGETSGASGRAFTYDGWSSKNTMTFGQCCSESMNFVSSVITELMTELSSNYDAYVDGLWGDTGYSLAYANHADMRGLAYTSMLLNGCFFDEDHMSDLMSRVDSAAFLRGATVAYRVFKHDPSATQEEVKAWYQSLKPKSIDGSVYSGYNNNQYFTYYLDTSCMIYRDDGSGPYPALRSYSDTITGPFMVRVGGSIAYWEMLKAAGVECTFGESVSDAQGFFVGYAEEEEGTSTTGGSSVKAVRERIARCAASFAYSTIDESRGRDGTDLYKRVHDAVVGSWALYQSCDYAACSAIRWAGADDNFEEAPTSQQLPYLLDHTERWQEIDWGGDVSLLEPGDVLIRNDKYTSGGAITDGVGHIVIYCGTDIIHEYHPDASSSSCIAHASYLERGPGCGPMYSTIYTFQCFRLVQPETDSRYANVIPYV